MVSSADKNNNDVIFNQEGKTDEIVADHEKKKAEEK